MLYIIFRILYTMQYYNHKIVILATYQTKSIQKTSN